MSESTESEETTTADAGASTESTTSEETAASTQPGWRDGLPADMRDNPALQSFGDVSGLAKSYLHGQELIGAKGIVLPKNDSQEEQNRFYSELGRPDEASDYDLGDFAPPENMDWDHERQTSMLGIMHEAGLNPTQVNKIIRAFAEGEGERYNEAKSQLSESHVKSVDALKVRWGVAYDANVDLANRMFKHAFGKDRDAVRNIVLPDGSSIGSNVMFVEAMHKMGQGMKEDTLRGDESSTSFTKAPNEAQEELSRLAIDKQFVEVLWDKAHPEHQRAVDKQAALFAQAYPEPVE